MCFPDAVGVVWVVTYVSPVAPSLTDTLLLFSTDAPLLPSRDRFLFRLVLPSICFSES